MKKIFDIFKIKKEERVSALAALIIACALNALTVIKYHSQFSQITDNYHKLFVKTFHVAGFDPLTYSIVSHWDTEYNVYRHPLLAFFMYIPNQINQGLMMLTGINCVQFVVGAILVFCAFYSFIFLYRIFREVIGTERFDANLLSAFYFSFAYVMVSAMICRPFHHVDDHTPLYPVYHRRMHEERQTTYHPADYPALCIYSGRIAQQWSEDLSCRPFHQWQKVLQYQILPDRSHPSLPHSCGLSPMGIPHLRMA